MSLERLPTEILISIAASHLARQSSANNYLQLRLVNRRFDGVILHALFELDIGRLYFPRHFNELARSEHFVRRYWRARLQRPTLAKHPNRIVTKTPRATELSAAQGQHVEHIQSALQSAIQYLNSDLKVHCATALEPYCDAHSTHLDQASPADRTIHLLCKSALCIYGPQKTWTLLGANIEEDASLRYVRPEDHYISLHHDETWLLYAAAYLNDTASVKAILEPIRFTPENRLEWRRRVSTTFFISGLPFAASDGATRTLRQPPVTRNEQRWVRLTASALIIAASVGHVDLVAYLLQLEPYIMRKVFRTQFYFAAGNNAMTAAVANNQVKVFQLLCRHRWPLVTRTGFARKEYFSALDTAVAHARYYVAKDSILVQLLDMSNDWKSPYFLERMLHAATIRNNTDLATIVLDQMVDMRARMFSNHWSIADQPRCAISARPFNFALGTAADLGHVECVETFLKYQRRSPEAGVHAIECAIHLVVCNTKDITRDHVVLLEHLLQHASGLFLEDVVLRAAYGQGENIMTIFAANVNLNQPTYSLWDRYQPRHCRSTTSMETTGILDPETHPSIGEVALAAALKGFNYPSARVLVKYHGVALRGCFVQTGWPDSQIFMDELADLREVMLDKGMVVEEVADDKPEGEVDQGVSLGLLFRPTSSYGSTLREFHIGHSHYCTL